MPSAPDERAGASDRSDGATVTGRDGAAGPAFAPGSVLVRFRAGIATARSREQVIAQISGTFTDKDRDGVHDAYANLDPSGNLMKVDLAGDLPVDKALAILRADPSVLYAEPNYVVHALATPNDAQFGALWGLHNTGQTGGTADADIDAPEAWNITTGSPSVVVGVVDTGIDYTHQDLAANMWANPGEIAGNGLDDDGNGVIDDVHGYNAVTNGGDPLDDNGHGTHCAGTLGAVGNNGVGVTGVSWRVSLMALKFLTAGGSGTTADAIEAIDYAIGRKNAGVNLRVLSNSWGGGGFSQALADAITAANAADILFVAAAGGAGSNNDTSPTYPASYDVPNVFAVAATDHNDNLASFSNYGPTTVHLGAPGVNTLSTTLDNTYATFSGTSMSTALVAGAAALVLAYNPSLSTAALKAGLMTSGDVRPGLVGKTVGGKRLNVAAALTEVGPPGPSFAMNATPASLTINQGSTASYQASLLPVAGFTGNVNLTVTSQPALNATVTATPPTVAVPGSSTISVATTAATAPGSYQLTITAVSGSLTRSRTVALLVRAAGTVEVAHPSTDTPLPIPDDSAAGISSTITVTQPMTVAEVQVDLNITHTFIGDLRVTLTSPSGTVVTLHDRTGGSADNLHQTYAFPTQFSGQQAAGAWVLHVDDNAALDTGTLDSWTLRLLGVPTAPPRPRPTLSIERVSRNRSKFEFSALLLWAGAQGGQVELWRNGLISDLPDNTGTRSDTFRRYETAFTWKVCELHSTLVCSNEVSVVMGASDSLATVIVKQADGATLSKVVPIVDELGEEPAPPKAQDGPPTLSLESLSRNRAKFEFSANLTWGNVTGTQVELWRNGVIVDLPDNDLNQRDSFRRYETSYTWKLCGLHVTPCSNEVSVVLGSSADTATSATVTLKGADGIMTSRVVPILDVK